MSSKVEVRERSGTVRFSGWGLHTDGERYFVETTVSLALLDSDPVAAAQLARVEFTAAILNLALERSKRRSEAISRYLDGRTLAIQAEEHAGG